MAFNVATISGSLRKRSFNTALMRSLPALALADLDLSEAPPYDRMPLYNADIQFVGFPADVITFRRCDPQRGRRDYREPGIQLDDSGRVEECTGLGVKAGKTTVQGQAGCDPVRDWRSDRRRSHAIPPADGADVLNTTIFGTPEVFVGLAQTKFEGSCSRTSQPKSGRRTARCVRQIHCTPQGLGLLEWRDQPCHHHPWPVWRIEEQRHRQSRACP
jgi:chromate reductase, NAD(P)H dehydrogenase (quinone)